MRIFYVEDNIEDDVNGDTGVYRIYSINVDGATYYKEPPGLLSRIESPRHAFPKTNS